MEYLFFVISLLLSFYIIRIQGKLSSLKKVNEYEKKVNEINSKYDSADLQSVVDESNAKWKRRAGDR